MNEEAFVIWKKLYDELMEIRKSGEWKYDYPTNVNAILDQVVMWVETGNPFYMENADAIALKLDCPVTKTFKEQKLLAIKARRDGVKGTWSQVKRRSDKNMTYLLICNLRFQGIDIDEASSLAAVWLHKNGGNSYADGSLERLYQAEFVNPGSERRYHMEWQRMVDEGHMDRSNWRTFVEFLQEVRAKNPPRFGTRR